MLVQMLYGVWTNSLGLISDAIHMAFDCMAIGVGLLASVMATWEPNERFTYGYGRIETLSGFANGIFLILISIFIVFEAIQRIIDPPEMNTNQLLLVSSVGLAVNLFGMFAMGGHHHGGGGHSHSHGHSHSFNFSLFGGSSDDHGHSHDHGGHSHSEKGNHGHDGHGGHGHSHSAAREHRGHSHSAHEHSHSHSHSSVCDSSQTKPSDHSHSHSPSNVHPHSPEHSHSHSHQGHDHGSDSCQTPGHDHGGHSHSHSTTQCESDSKQQSHSHSHSPPPDLSATNPIGHSRSLSNTGGGERSTIGTLASRRHSRAGSLNIQTQFGDTGANTGGELPNTTISTSSGKHHHPGPSVIVETPLEPTFSFTHDEHNEHHHGVHTPNVNHTSDHSHGHGGHAHGHSHNMRGVFLHVMADTLGSVGVIISTLLIQWYGWTGFDPIASLFIAILIAASVFPLVIDTGKILALDVADKDVVILDALKETHRRLSGLYTSS
ncbi:hypothetical protein CC1G_14848 [Coprinopsis cinerea okayama7|uniref:Cation efflux protein transmembrane domain-containing protein n=1 Tax=Coprinopsis cinerea (strain Okayama-7 / 130 / ATCC MYA-4618 / FGSC 9003) TaxID=240176 RepID=D6RNQ9_COPC7|nr:hypothetical protein CC1G_14848 [Coprinopsis cinerea okayama7\|eukprot:XP_002910871.1 hypothetical protein CC1G_14848 [Coprinopsis cinerea okayama7\